MATTQADIVREASEDDWRYSAGLMWADVDDLGFDSDADVAVCDEDPATLGAWVRAWVFVPVARLRNAKKA